MSDASEETDDAQPQWVRFRDGPLPLNPAQQLGDYRLIDEIGHGGMGVVFTARHVDSADLVAVKILIGRGVEEPRFRQRFLREARIAAAISHPHIARIHGVFEQGRLLFIVMDYIAGGTLRARINQTPVRDLHWVIRVAKQVAQGLSAAHRAGVIHRDIKPSNILLDPSGEHAWIADFGLAVFEVSDESLTSSGKPVGTPAYMSPEQARGEPLDKRSDLFSLGCLIHAMITGQSPFQASNVLAVMRRIVDFHPPLLDQRYEGVPASLAAIVDRLLQKDPADRFANADDVYKALDLCENGLPSSSQVLDSGQTTLADQPARSVRRKWFVAVSLTLLACVVACGGWAALARRGGGGEVRPLVAPTTARNSPPVAPLVTPRDPDRPVSPRGRRWTVSVSQRADFDSLSAALDAARPYDTVEVLDGATYDGPFVIDDPYRLEGLTLTTNAHAILTAPPDAGRIAVVSVQGTRRVRIHGFRISAPRDLHTVSLSGEVAGLELAQSVLEQPVDSTWANVLLARECRGTEGEPVAIRECRVRSAVYGIFLGRIDIENVLESDYILIDGNRFSGSGKHVVVLNSAAHIRIEHNVFERGAGVEFHLEGSRQSGPFAVCNNSFFACRTWIEFGPDRADYAGLACNNLIVGSDPPAYAGTGQRNELWSFHHNVWEGRPDSSDAVIDGFGVVTADAGLRSRDPDSAEFLQPTEGTLAASQGAGPPLPQYVGARSPQRPGADANDH